MNKGIPIKWVNYILAGIILLISVLLLVTAYKTSYSYKELHSTTEEYIEWQKNASNMMVGSDYLTDQVRYYVESGDRAYLDNYFEESHNTKRRDEALEFIRGLFDGTRAYEALLEAMSQSVSLMDREYYAMRLRIESLGLDAGDYPEELQNVTLSAEDSALSPDEKAVLSRSMVFDEYYHIKKDMISRNTQSCLSELVNQIESRQAEASSDLRNLLVNEQILIVVLIAIVFVIVFLTTFQVISPLVRAVPRIKDEKPLPIQGAFEFRFLAKTYNQMYEANKISKEKLAYEASHDQLTGLYNRSGFEKLLKGVDYNSTALMIADVDWFKNVNDTYGHDTGDVALKRVADTLFRNFRSDDYICRIGGDEFAVFILNTNQEHADMIRKKTEIINRELESETENCPALSLSFGVAFGNKQRGGIVFKNADIALYEAKESGRKNCKFFIN